MQAVRQTRGQIELIGRFLGAQHLHSKPFGLNACVMQATGAFCVMMGVRASQYNY